MKYHINVILTFNATSSVSDVQQKIQALKLFNDPSATIDIQPHESTVTAHCTVLAKSAVAVDILNLKKETGAVFASITIGHA